MTLPRPLVRLFKWMLDRGYANCLIFAMYMQAVHGGKIVLQPTSHNKISWIVWWHVKWKPKHCPVYGECPVEEAFEPYDYKDVWLPPIIFHGRKVGGSNTTQKPKGD